VSSDVGQGRYLMLSSVNHVILPSALLRNRHWGMLYEPTVLRSLVRPRGRDSLLFKEPITVATVITEAFLKAIQQSKYTLHSTGGKKIKQGNYTSTCQSLSTVSIKGA
jgi:hypothetical protein